MFSINGTIIEVFYELLPELEATKLFIDLISFACFFLSCSSGCPRTYCLFQTDCLICAAPAASASSVLGSQPIRLSCSFSPSLMLGKHVTLVLCCYESVLLLGGR